jgi:hypothetical protein
VSPRGGYRVTMPPNRGKYHTISYRSIEVTSCGRPIGYFWKGTTEYQAFVTHGRKPCSRCHQLRDRQDGPPAASGKP